MLTTYDASLTLEPLVSPRDAVHKAAYVLANLLAAGLVRRGKEWPGLWPGPEWIGGEPITAKRPEGFFR